MRPQASHSLSLSLFLHDLKYLSKSGNYCKTRTSQTVFCKILGGREREIPLVRVFEKPCILYPPSWTVKVHSKWAVVLLAHLFILLPATCSGIFLGIHPSLSVSVDPVGWTPTPWHEGQHVGHVRPKYGIHCLPIRGSN